MILLIGGTSETASLAQALASAGFSVVVSTATDLPLEIGNHPNISRTSGALDSQGIKRLAYGLHAGIIVDASHPYATAVKANAKKAAAALGIPYVQWTRPLSPNYEDWIIIRETHELAAKTACAFGRPVLVTTGAKNLAPYAAEAQRTGIHLVVRVLPYSNSLEACRKAGIEQKSVIIGRGPFSFEENVK
ncbi:MAG: precorrin-6A/cobalt-precorrin-6A reductase, partial [Desulfomonile sp.]|nr:precorrin-6A/cobalt-precorrin-6A reductase [Desulfomonile sp.]